MRKAGCLWWILSSGFVFGCDPVIAQADGNGCRIMFYNVENYFDPYDDSLARDEEFTPEGDRSWTYTRFKEKAVRIARVIIACGDPDPPAIVGLAEVENRFVLEKLVYETPLKSLGYRIVHQDSPDSRGIDVALIYRKEAVRVDTCYYSPVIVEDSGYRTREMLFAGCVLYGKHPVMIAVCHWPSRYGGAADSEPRRLAAAETLIDRLTETFHQASCPNIIVMGDFNDEPGDPSIQLLTNWQFNGGSSGISGRLVNLSESGISPEYPGTIKHQGFWRMFDQVLVSESLASGSGGLAVRNKKAAVFHAAFLLEVDNSHLGEKPFRTFIGPAYHGGFSDHLPVYIDVLKF